MTRSPELNNAISVVTGHVNCEYRFPDRDFTFVKDGVGGGSPVDSNLFPGGYQVYESPTDVEGTELSLLPHVIIQILLKPSGSEQSRLEYENDSRYLFHLRGSYEDPGLQSHLPYVTFQVGELPRQEELRMVTAHAAAVVSPEKTGVLILGDKGTGKTSVCIELGIGRGYGLVGNNMVIVKDSEKFPRLVSGTRALVVRQATLESIPSLVKEMGHGRETKITLTPEELGIKLAESPSEIGTVVRVNIHPGQPEAVHVTGITDGLTERLRLFENFARYIRGVTTPLSLTENHVSGFIPSFDTQTLSSMRNQLIERLLKLPFYYISGNSIAAVVEKVDSIVKSV